MTVNSKLAEIENANERGYLRLIVVEVANLMLSKIILPASESMRLVTEIKSALETTATLKGYNFEALVALLRLGEIQINQSFRTPGIYYYDWNGKPEDLTELIQTMRSEGWINSVKEFRKLFTAHAEENLSISFSSDKKDDLLVLFEELKLAGLITPRGNKGHFMPLRAHLFNFENNLLFDTNPKTIRMMAKRDREKWEMMSKRAKQWISGFKVKIPSGYLGQGNK